jgi:ribonuclease Z
MDILFLGTSSGVPTKERNVTSIALIEEKGRAWYMVDCGEATQHQLMQTPLSLNDLQIIFITHVHGDHCFGLPGLLASAGMNGGRKAPLTIVAPYGIQQWLENTIEMTQMYLPYELKFMATETLDKLSYRDFIIRPCQLSHRVKSYAYTFVESQPAVKLNVEKLNKDQIPQGPFWSQIQKGEDIEFEGKVYPAHEYLIQLHKPRKIIISGDNDQPESTYTKDIAEKVPHAGHSCAEQVAKFAESIALPNLLLTHFSARYVSNLESSPSIADIENEARRYYSGNLFLAKDFARYRLDKSGKLTGISPT